MSRPPARLPIIRTKLHRPAVTAPGLISRGRLLDRLAESLSVPLALVTAPAGYGKSVLVSQWVESLDEPCAWVSLDAEDAELETFVSYVVAAVGKAVPELSGECASMIAAPVPPSHEILVCCLLNELDEIDRPFVLVLDDYHSIPIASLVHDLIRSLHDYPPCNMRTILMTRRDPPLPLASWRASHLVSELRTTDLQFTPTETAEFLAQNMNLKLDQQALRKVHRLTEGWAVGLHLLMLYARNLEDPSSLLRNLEGNIRDIGSYLVEEVFAKQPEDIQAWLLKTSILDQFTPELCEVVARTGEHGATAKLTGKAYLDFLQRENLFVTMLDAKGKWYRYHHLFQEVLQDRLRRSHEPEEILHLHRAASAWCEEQGMIRAAIVHALSASDSAGALQILLRNRNAEWDADRWYEVERWLTRLRPEIQENHPALVLTEALVAHFHFQIEKIPGILARLGEDFSEESIEPQLAGELELLRGCLAYWTGEGAMARDELRAALKRLENPMGSHAGLSRFYLGLTRYQLGEGEAASAELESEIRLDDPAHDLFYSHLSRTRVFIAMLGANAQEASRELPRFQTLTSRSGSKNTSAWCQYLEGSVSLQRNELAKAEEYFRGATEQRFILEPRAVLDAWAGLVLVEELQGKRTEADLDLLGLEAVVRGSSNPSHVAISRATRARCALLRGELEEAYAWAAAANLTTAATEFFLWVEVPALTQARILIAQKTEHSLERALQSLGELRELCDQCRYLGQLMEIDVLRSLALDAQGKRKQALGVLGEVLLRAEAGNWIHPVLEPGPAIVPLLTELEHRDELRSVMARLQPLLVAQAPTADPRKSASGELIHHGEFLVESLTGRELDILELLARRFYNKEIADQLNISSHTVNDHLKHIYQKLGVHNRREAVRFAQEARLLKRPASD